MKTKITKRITNPHLVLVLNKHHTREFYVLAEKEFLLTPGKTRGSDTKRVGPAIIQIDQIGVRREIVKHPINGREVWVMLSNYSKAGLWALNNRFIAPLLPKDLLAASNRFRKMSVQQQTRMAKKTSKELRRIKNMP